MFYQWKPYVSVAERRRKAQRAAARSARKGRTLSPVAIAGQAIARTFWGKAWCRNMERYSDYSNRLPRGRTYVRNGSVIDLQIAAGEVRAQVVGSDVYTTTVKVTALPGGRWKNITADCAGSIDSLVELLQGQFSKGVMERVCRPETGLFPSPKEIAFDCSCPDWATMCKHVAAVLYGIGARLDERPELLFTLRKVDAKQLVARASAALPLGKKAPAAGKILDGSQLAEVFGIEMADVAVPPASKPAPFLKRAAPVPSLKPAAPLKCGQAKPARRAKKPAVRAIAVKGRFGKVSGARRKR